MSNLDRAIELAQKIGLQGVCIIDQGGAGKYYLALCVDRHGRTCDPRGWDTKPTPDEAVTELLRAFAMMSVGYQVDMPAMDETKQPTSHASEVAQLLATQDR